MRGTTLLECDLDRSTHRCWEVERSRQNPPRWVWTPAPAFPDGGCERRCTGAGEWSTPAVPRSEWSRTFAARSRWSPHRNVCRRGSEGSGGRRKARKHGYPNGKTSHNKQGPIFYLNIQKEKMKAITRGIGLAVRMPKHLVVSSGGYSFLRRKLSSSGRGVVRTIPITYK